MIETNTYLLLAVAIVSNIYSIFYVSTSRKDVLQFSNTSNSNSLTWRYGSVAACMIIAEAINHMSYYSLIDSSSSNSSTNISSNSSSNNSANSFLICYLLSFSICGYLTCVSADSIGLPSVTLLSCIISIATSILKLQRISSLTVIICSISSGVNASIGLNVIQAWLINEYHRLRLEDYTLRDILIQSSCILSSFLSIVSLFLAYKMDTSYTSEQTIIACTFIPILVAAGIIYTAWCVGPATATSDFNNIPCSTILQSHSKTIDYYYNNSAVLGLTLSQGLYEVSMVLSIVMYIEVRSMYQLLVFVSTSLPLYMIGLAIYSTNFKSKASIYVIPLYVNLLSCIVSIVLLTIRSMLNVRLHVLWLYPAAFHYLIWTIAGFAVVSYQYIKAEKIPSDIRCASNAYIYIPIVAILLLMHRYIPFSNKYELFNCMCVFQGMSYLCYRHFYSRNREEEIRYNEMISVPVVHGDNDIEKQYTINRRSSELDIYLRGMD